MGEYHEVSYWIDRYTNDTEPFEWYVSIDELRAFISPVINSILARLSDATSLSPSHAKLSRHVSLSRRSSLVSQAVDNSLTVGSSPVIGARPSHFRRASEVGLYVSASVGPRARRISIVANEPNQGDSPLRPRRSLKMPRRSLEPLRLIDDTVQILEVGCGSSSLSVELARTYGDRVRITAIDYADQLIDEMRVLYADLKNLTWETMDARQLSFPDDYFDLVIEKACLDCVHCNSPLDETHDPSSRTNIVQAVSEIERVLKANGHFISVSHAQPDVRTHHFLLDNLFYEKVGNELAKKAKEQRRASIGPRGSITISALAQSPARMARGAPLVSALAGKWVFDRPAIHPVDRIGRALPESTSTSEADEASRVLTGNIGGWLDNQFFVYVMQKSRLLGDIAGRSNIGTARRSSLLASPNQLQRPTLSPMAKMKTSGHQINQSNHHSVHHPGSQTSAGKRNSLINSHRSPRTPIMTMTINISNDSL